MTATKLTWCDLLKRRSVAVYTVLAVARSALLVAAPLLLGRVVDALVARTPPYRTFLALLGTALAGVVLEWLLRRLVLRISRDAELELQHRLLAKFQSLAPGHSCRTPPGETALKFFRDAPMLGEFLRSFYPQILGAACAVLFSLAAALNKSFVIAGLFLVFIPLLMLPSVLWRTRFRRLRQALRRFNDLSVNKVFECMHVFPYLKSLAADTPYFERTGGLLRRGVALNRRHDFSEADFEHANRAVLFLGEYTVLAVSCVLAYRGRIPVGDVVVFQALFLAVLNALAGVFRLLPNLENVRESLRSVNELLDDGAVETADSGTVITSVNGELRAENVSFSYPGSDREILHDFSVSIPGGSIVGITGENGAGKTTLLKLLTGTLVPVSGSVSVSGVDLKNCNLAAFRTRIASVFQETLLITGTIRDNITLKDDRYSAADIDCALKISGADALVARVPEGLEHRIGFNDGGGLSGGERQKLAIARALIRRPDILIFDEVTNHLDYESRLKMRDLLTELRGHTTVLLVSHDPELIKLCDIEIRF